MQPLFCQEEIEIVYYIDQIKEKKYFIRAKLWKADNYRTFYISSCGKSDKRRCLLKLVTKCGNFADKILPINRFLQEEMHSGTHHHLKWLGPFIRSELFCHVLKHSGLSKICHEVSLHRSSMFHPYSSRTFCRNKQELERLSLASEKSINEWEKAKTHLEKLCSLFFLICF